MTTATAPSMSGPAGRAGYYPAHGLWRLAWRLGRQQGQHGMLYGFVLAVVLATATLLCVALVADRLQQASQHQGRDFLAADRVVVASAPLADTWWPDVVRDWPRSETLSFNSMLFAGDQPQLASIRAVGPGYPLYGRLQLMPQRPPQPGEIWLSARLMQRLQAKPGMSIEVGQRQLTVAGTLLQLPDEGFSPAELAPKALMLVADVPSTGILLPGSRVEYRYQLRHPPAVSPAAADRALRQQLQGGQRLLTPELAEGQAGRAMQNGEHLFRLAALTALVLASLAMHSALTHFARDLDRQVALLKTLGARRVQLWAWLGMLLGALSALGLAGGALGGYLLHLGFIHLLGEVLPADLPPPSWQPLGAGLLMLLMLILVLAIVPFARLLATPPQQVLRDSAPASDGPGRGLLVALLGGGLFAWLFTGDARLAGGLLLGMAAGLGGLGLIGYVLLWLPWPLRRGSAAALAVGQLRRARGSSFLQLAALTLAMLLPGMLWGAYQSLLAGVDSHQLQQAPNRYLINIAEDDRAALSRWLTAQGQSSVPLYPVIRGRLTAIAGEPVASEPGAPGRPGIYRELSMSWMPVLPAYNPLQAGEPWHGDGGDEVSVEAGTAQRLGIGLGDTLSFEVEGETLQARVTSLRTVRWQDMQPNFIMIFAPKVLQARPASWMASVRVTPGDLHFERDLVQQFPGITLIDTDQLLQRLISLLGGLGRGLGLLLSLVAAAAGLVLYTRIQAAMAQRWQSLVLMRTLGAGARQLQQMLYWEWIVAGLLAGLLAAAGSEVVLWWVLPGWLEQGSWQLHPALWWGLPLVACVLMALSAYRQTRRLLSSVLARRLREEG